MSEMGNDIVDSLRGNIIGFFRESGRLNPGKSPYANNLECQRYAEAYVSIFNDILSTGEAGVDKLKPLLMDPHPGVRLRVAGEMENIDIERSIQVYRELAARPNDERGIPDVYAAGARLSLNRLSRTGLIK